MHLLIVHYKCDLLLITRKILRTFAEFCCWFCLLRLFVSWLRSIPILLLLFPFYLLLVFILSSQLLLLLLIVIAIVIAFPLLFVSPLVPWLAFWLALDVNMLEFFIELRLTKLMFFLKVLLNCVLFLEFSLLISYFMNSNVDLSSM